MILYAEGKKSGLIFFAEGRIAYDITGEIFWVYVHKHRVFLGVAIQITPVFFATNQDYFHRKHTFLYS